MTLQEQMVRYRAKHKLTQGMLADEIGLSKQTVCAIEKGIRKPSRVTKEKIRLIVGEQDENEDFSIET